MSTHTGRDRWMEQNKSSRHICNYTYYTYKNLDYDKSGISNHWGKIVS